MRKYPVGSELVGGLSAGRVEAGGNASGVTAVVIIKDGIVQGVGGALLGHEDELGTRDESELQNHEVSIRITFHMLLCKDVNK